MSRTFLIHPKTYVNFSFKDHLEKFLDSLQSLKKNVLTKKNNNLVP